MHTLVGQLALELQLSTKRSGVSTCVSSAFGFGEHSLRPQFEENTLPCPPNFFLIRNSISQSQSRKAVLTFGAVRGSQREQGSWSLPLEVRLQSRRPVVEPELGDLPRHLCKHSVFSQFHGRSETNWPFRTNCAERNNWV